ncbi:Hypothetical_protein [Hexamita inflata]|uniref:Hypothetical_protein n=1 Tax=Hexamita inflata TaxID=28002 RepID=A0AA86PC59_9EUKA|nr:Hypothetical protein HINF_LOCUS23884 [Hexamita inflata]
MKFWICQLESLHPIDQRMVVDTDSGEYLGILACHQRAFKIGKRQPLHCFLRNADGTTQVDSRIDRLARSSRITPLDACTRVVGCLGVSKTNDHSRELTVPVQKTELVETKVK